MKEGAYYDWLQQQLLEDYIFLQQVSTNPKMRDIAAHMAKAQVAINDLYSRLKEAQK